VKKRRVAKTTLRELAGELGVGELARRTGYAASTIARAARTGELSGAMREAIREAWERRERAREAALEQARQREARREAAERGAETRRLKRTRLDPQIAERVGVEKIAQRLGRSEATVKRWVKKGGAPTGALDAARALAAGQAAYPLDWEHGTERTLPKTDAVDLRKVLRQFVAAVDVKAPREEIAKLYRDWRRVKARARGRLTERAWEELVDRLGDELGLPDLGTFSKERFKRS